MGRTAWRAVNAVCMCCTPFCAFAKILASLTDEKSSIFSGIAFPEGLPLKDSTNGFSQ